MKFNQQDNMTGTEFLETRKYRSRASPQVTQVIEGRVSCRKAATTMILMKTQDLSKKKTRKLHN